MIRPPTPIFLERRRLPNRTQQKIADRARIRRWRYCQIETGRINPTDQELAAIAQALGVSPADLIEAQR